MLKIFGIDKYKFYLSNITTSIIYNDESIKNKIIDKLIKEKYLVIDSKVINSRITVKEYLKGIKFNMKLIPYYELNNILNKRLNELNFETQIFIKIISFITSRSERVIFDDVLTFLNPTQKYLVLKFIKDNMLP